MSQLTSSSSSNRSQVLNGSSERKICRVGYAFNEKKLGKSDLKRINSLSEWEGGGLADIINASDVDDGILFYPLDLVSIIKYDVIIHKLTDDLERSEPSDKLRDLQRYISLNPDVILVDPLSSVSLVTSRQRICECISDIEGPLMNSVDSGESHQFIQPKHFIVENKMSNDEFVEQMHIHGVQFPIICKPVTACGTPLAHLMSVIVRIDDVMKLIKPPCVVQQFLDHDSTLYKVYVLGEDVMVFRRPSLPDLDLNQPIVSVEFDSRSNYPTLGDFYRADCDYPIPKSTIMTGEKLNEKLPIPIHLFELAAHRMKGRFGLTLFGFDVILCYPNQHSPSHSTSDERVPEMVVVDVNFFPSYKEVPDFPSRLLAHLRGQSKLS